LDKIEAKIFVQNYRTLKQIKFDFQQKPDDLDNVCGEWLHGPSDVGKSHTARTENPGFYEKMLNKWWDQYEGEDVVLIDDVDKSCEFLGQFLKRWADKYSFRVEIKNHSVLIRPKKIIVTSQYLPSQIWRDPAMIEAINRRFKFRLIQRLLPVDNLISKKRNYTPSKLKKHDLIAMKKPKPYIQKNGKIVQNKKPVLQKQILDFADDPLEQQIKEDTSKYDWDFNSPDTQCVQEIVIEDTVSTTEEEEEDDPEEYLTQPVDSDDLESPDEEDEESLDLYEM